MARKDHRVRRPVRSVPLWLLAALALLVIGCLQSCSKAPRPKPNVILVVIDTLRADHIHGYGYARQTTPNLDRLMTEGAAIDAAISNSNWSPPSHTTIITGTHSHQHQVMNFEQDIAAGIQTLPSLLQTNGYATGLFSSHLPLHQGVRRISEGYDTRFIVPYKRDPHVLSKAAKWAIAQQRPFFSNIVLMGPHAPYNKHPSSYDENYFTDTPAGGDRTFPFTKTVWRGEGAIPRSVRLGDHQKVGVYINRYDRAIRYTDENLGGFLDELREAGLLDNTLVVVTSDHGEGLGDHDAFAHELYLYDFLIRVPLVFWYPGVIEGGQRWQTQVPTIDIASTVLGFAGMTQPEWMPGRDLSDALIRAKPPEQPILTQASYRNAGFDRHMIRSDRYKLILDTVERHEEFYDLHDDPSENSNLLEQETPSFPDAEYQKLRKAMQTLLENQAEVQSDRVDVPITDEVLEELRALGYVEEDE